MNNSNNDDSNSKAACRPVLRQRREPRLPLPKMHAEAGAVAGAAGDSSKKKKTND